MACAVTTGAGGPLAIAALSSADFARADSSAGGAAAGEGIGEAPAEAVGAAEVAGSAAAAGTALEPVLVARRDGHVLAYAFARPVHHASVTWATDRDALELETLTVSPDARGSGLGARLVALVREEVERGGYEGLYLTAVAGNADALRFYEREGFTPEFITLRDTTRRP